MIPNLANAVLGLWLVYLAVLDPSWGTNRWVLGLAGVVVLVLAWWARGSDYRKWQSSVNLVLGVVLLLLAALDWADLLTPLALFWGVFWPGILVAIFALWAALYRPQSIMQEDATQK
jgi:hypothetical protein